MIFRWNFFFCCYLNTLFPHCKVCMGHGIKYTHWCHNLLQASLQHMVRKHVKAYVITRVWGIIFIYSDCIRFFWDYYITLRWYVASIMFWVIIPGCIWPIGITYFSRKRVRHSITQSDQILVGIQIVTVWSGPLS